MLTRQKSPKQSVEGSSVKQKGFKLEHDLVASLREVASATHYSIEGLLTLILEEGIAAHSLPEGADHCPDLIIVHDGGTAVVEIKKQRQAYGRISRLQKD